MWFSVILAIEERDRGIVGVFGQVEQFNVIKVSPFSEIVGCMPTIQVQRVTAFPSVECGYPRPDRTPGRSVWFVDCAILSTRRNTVRIPGLPATILASVSQLL